MPTYSLYGYAHGMRLTVEEKQRDEGLILGRYSRIFIDSQMDEESFDFGTHIFGMAPILEKDEVLTHSMKTFSIRIE